MKFNTSYPSLQDLKRCADENGLNRNQHDLQNVRLQQHFIRPAVREPNLKTTLCGISYDYPFGISSVVFQGVIWPNASKILAKTAKEYNIPYVMSTFCTNSIEEIAEESEGNAPLGRCLSRTPA